LTQANGTACTGYLEYPLENGSFAFANALLLITFLLISNKDGLLLIDCILIQENMQAEKL